MAEREPSVGAPTRRRVLPTLLLACLLVGACGQKGVLVPVRPASALAAASSPDTLPIPGVSPADLPTPVPQR
jgi:hypothetical protein